MPSRVQGRIGEHGNAVERDLVEQTRSVVAASTTLPSITLLVIVKANPVVIAVGLGADGLIGADHGAHTAADATMIDIGALADTGKGTAVVTTFFLQDVELWHALSAVGQIDGLGRADGSAAPAKGAAILAVFDDPGQIVIG